jgi:benzoyl-CoA reductase/2-hydroxyglutaryl-CoA dehydratase subunit BcrC/BadD/HgdB
MNVPATWQTSAAKELYAGELRRLGRFLADRGGRIPPDSELAEAMKSFEADRSAAANASRKGVPVALIGGPRMRGEAWILDTINEMGGWVALDGTEGGVRTLPAPFDRQRLEEEPFEVLVDAYFGSIPAIFRRPDSMLYEWAAREVAASGARGVILMRYTWCDMWAIARARLAEATGVAVLEVDLAGDAGVEVRAVNRIAAFMETLA